MTGLWLILTIVYTIVVLVSLVLVIEQMREPVWSFAWMMSIVFVPVVGLLLFILIGYRPARQRKTAPPHIERSERIPFITLLENNSDAKLAIHNRLEVLHNGDNTFSSIARELARARESIHIEYYIFCEDEVGTQIALLLEQKAREGVEVRLIFDAVGSWKLSKAFISRLRASGVEVGSFSPVLFPWFTHRLNYRNHRKIVVVDGKVAYTGGINIAERYLKGDTMGLWHDVHLRIEGDAVADFQRLFLSDWSLVRGVTIDSPRYFPLPEVTEQAPMQVVWSSVSSRWSAISQAFFAAITGAARTITISTPYFIPSVALLEALKVAALKGVDVRIVIPAKSDSRLVHLATCSFVDGLLSAGVKVYLYTAGFLHSKLIAVDGRMASVGTANMDIRSLEDNFEVSTFIYDREVVRQLSATLDDYISHSRRVMPDEWYGRSRGQRMLEALARLFSPLL